MPTRKGSSTILERALFLGAAGAASAILWWAYQRYNDDAPNDRATDKPPAAPATARGADKPSSSSSSSSSSSTQPSAEHPPSPGENVFALDPKGVTFLPLARRRRVNHNCIMLTFELPSREMTLGLEPGQHVTVCVTDDSSEEVIRRGYTPVTAPSVRGSFDLLVKVYPDGTISKYLGNLSVGDAVAFSGPSGRYIYRSGAHKHIGMICGGTGVTPMLQILRHIALDPSDPISSVALVCAHASPRDVLLAEEIAEIEAILNNNNNNNNNNNINSNNGPGSDNNNGRSNGENDENENGDARSGGVRLTVRYVTDGFVTEECLRETMPAPGEGVMLLMCGPQPMLKAMQGHTKALGYKRKMIYKF